MAPNQKTIRAFYSWQSDLPDASNRKAIRNALKSAAKSLPQSIIVDEATRDTSGSPNIPATILEKIGAADIFIADITTINHGTGPGRKCPNPNVVFELGYAVATLGWSRIVLLFNKGHGVFPDDVPFDFDRHRVSPYQLGSSPNNGEKISLAALAKKALTAIIDSDPKRPSELKGQPPEYVRHIRDVENLTWLLGTLHIPTLDHHISQLPRTLNDRSMSLFGVFEGIVSANSLFYLNDQVLLTDLKRLCTSWSTTLSHAAYYHDAPNPDLYVFTNPGDMPLMGEKDRVWKEIQAAGLEMREALDTVLSRVREEFPEINLHETNTRAFEVLKEMHA